jgi:hypothetical protein
METTYKEDIQTTINILNEIKNSKNKKYAILRLIDARNDIE